MEAAAPRPHGTLSVVRALWIVLVLASSSLAVADERDMCGTNARYRGTTRDLDVKDADIRDVFRLLADTGKFNLVVADDVRGKVTLRLSRVPWDQILCTVAAVHKLRVTLDRNIVMITRR